MLADVILVVYENQKGEIQSTLDKYDLEIKIEYFCIPSNEDLGTADSLRLLEERLKSDVIVMSCDLMTDININDVLDLFRKHNASLCTLLFNPLIQEPVVVPGPKSKHKPGKFNFYLRNSEIEACLGVMRFRKRSHWNRCTNQSSGIPSLG